MRHQLACLLPLLLLASCSDRSATAVMTAIAVDAPTRSAAPFVRIAAHRGDEQKFRNGYPADTFQKPASITFRDASDGDSHALLRVVVEGFDQDPEKNPQLTPRIQRSARLAFVPEKTKLLRLGLSEACLDVKCKESETCRNGACEGDTIEDASTLPDVDEEAQKLPDLGKFDDLGKGGSAGAAGSAGASGASGQGGASGEGGASGQGGLGGGGSGGASGSGGAGAGGCDGVEPPALSVEGEGLEGTTLGAAVDAKVALTLKASQGTLDDYSVAWTLDGAGVDVSSALSVSAGGASAQLDVAFCQATLAVQATHKSCPGVHTSAVKIAVQALGQGLYVNRSATTCGAAGAQCGARLVPWCTLGEGVTAAQKRLAAGEAGPMVVKVAQTKDGEAYLEPVRLPPGVGVAGAYAADFVGPPQANGTTSLGLPAGADLAPDAIPTSGAEARSVLSAGAADTTSGVVELSGLTVLMPPTSSDPAQADQRIFAGIHLHGALDATLRSVRVLPSQPGKRVGENAEGVYVSGPGAGKIDLVGCALAPPGSQLSNANGLKVDRGTQAAVRVCGGSVESGGAADGKLATGVLFWGAGALTVGAPSDCGVAGDEQGATVRGGAGGRSYGVWHDAEKASALTVRNATLVGVAKEALGAVVPSEVAGLLINAAVASKAKVSGSSLRGVDASAPSSTAAKLFATISGLAAYPSDASNADPAFSLSLSESKVQGVVGALGPQECQARGLSLLGGQRQVVQVEGGLIAGGGACSQRIGAFVENYSIAMDTGPAQGQMAEVRGSVDTQKQGSCSTGWGMKLLGYTVPAPQGPQVQGGVIVGGDDCQERGGIAAQGNVNLQQIDALGTEAFGAKTAFGVQIDNTATADDVVIGGNSKLVGGVVQQPDAAQESMAVGLWLRSNGKSTIDGNSEIRGCAAGCSGSVVAIGALVERLQGASVKQPTTDAALKNNGLIVGGPVDGKDRGESVGLRVKGTSVEGPTAAQDAFIKDALVKVDGGKIVGNDGAALPLSSSGVEVLSAGGVQIQGTPQARIAVRGGNAAGTARGMSLCAGPTVDKTPCGELAVFFADIQGGSAPTVRAVESIHGGAGSKIKNSVIAAQGGPSTVDSAGLRLAWMPDAQVANNYVFGAEDGAGGQDAAFALIQPPDAGGPAGAFVFAYNLCIGGGSKAGVALGVRMEQLSLGPGQLLRVYDNIAQGGERAGTRVSWWFQKPPQSADKLPEFRGNMLVAYPPGDVSSAFLMASGDKLFMSGFCSPPPAAGPLGYGCNKPDGVQYFLSDPSNALLSVPTLPHAGKTLRSVDAWHPLSKDDCANLPQGAPLTNPDTTQIIDKDFDDDLRTKQVTPGPDQCGSPQPLPPT